MRTAKTKIRKNTWVAWSKDEIKLLKKLFPRGRAREIAKRTGRPLTAVRQKAYNMGMKTRQNRLWSADEIKLLKKLYPNEIVRSIADKLGRSYAAVIGKARTIGLNKKKAPLWSRQEIKMLKKMYPDYNKRDIANKLGRTVGAVVTRGCNFGLTEKSRVWSKRELNLLKKLYPSRTAQEIADQIGRSSQATQMRIHRLGLKKLRSSAKNWERMTKKYYKYEESHRKVKGRKQKYCTKCKKWREESQYNKEFRTKDGLKSWCKNCVLKYQRERYRKKGKDLKIYRRYEECHRVVGGMKQKRCWKCKRWKAESEFYKDRSRKDGLQSACKACSDKATNKSHDKRRLAV